MWPTLLDTETGERREASEFKTDWWWWAEGNGSCDCNRAIIFGKHDEMKERFSPTGDFPPGAGVCIGNTRFIAVDVHGDLEGIEKSLILEDLNREYPEELVAKHAAT